MGKANGSRECAPDDKLSVPTTFAAIEIVMVGTAQVRLCPPYKSLDGEVIFVIASEAKQFILSSWGEMDCFAALAMTGITFRGNPLRALVLKLAQLAEAPEVLRDDRFHRIRHDAQCF